MPPIAEKIPALLPALEAQVTRGMKAFDTPGIAIGIVAGDKLIYTKGFGVRAKDDPRPVDSRTVFQIGSAAKAFLATTMAITADLKKFKWDDRVVDLDPGFQMQDPWVTREFRVFDLIAQRSGLSPYANDGLVALGYKEADLIASLRDAKPLTSFRTTFAYTNITHLLAGAIVAKQRGADGWNAVARHDILDPLAMADSSFTPEAILAAPNHAAGHRWATTGSVQVPFDAAFPYAFGAAGNINSDIEDMSRWVRLQLGDGAFEGKQLVSRENLLVTRTPRVAMDATTSYALGWVVTQTPNGRVIWHNGGTAGFGAHVGFLPDKGVGLIVLTNLVNIGLADAIGLGFYDALLGNPAKDYIADALERARAGEASDAKRYAPRAHAAPPPDPATLTGSYASDLFGEVAVDRDGTGLSVTFKRTGAKLRLTPFDGPLYAVRLVAEGRFAPIVAMGSDGPTGFITFEPDASGAIARLTWLYDDTQTYSLTRR